MTEAAPPRKIEAGSWVWSREYECLVPRASFLRSKHNQSARSTDVPCPAIRPDGMAAIRSMADGRIYESRSAYYQSVKRAGCEIVGTEDPSSYVAKPPSERQVEADLVADVKRAIEECASK